MKLRDRAEKKPIQIFGIDDLTAGMALSGASSLLGGLFGFEGQQDTNQANAENVQKQMDFQERMSNTAYQRATKDMEAAGLNPMLAYSQGGASTPIGGAATFSNPAAAASQSASQAATTSMAGAQIEATKASAEAARADASLKEAQAATERGRPANVAEDTSRLRTQAELNVRQGDLTDTQNKEAQARIQKIFAETTNVDAQTALARVNKVMADYKLPELKSYSDFYKSAAGRSKPYQDWNIGTGAIGSTASEIADRARNAWRNSSAFGLKYDTTQDPQHYSGGKIK